MKGGPVRQAAEGALPDSPLVGPCGDVGNWRAGGSAVARVLGVTDAPPVVALLIDADNAALGSLDQVLTALADYGDVTIRRAYGNWFKPALKAWDPELTRRGIRPVQQSDPVKGKNATDLAMVIDAVDLHHTTRPDVYALVSSDSDYAPLAHFLRERGATVIGFGRANTAAVLPGRLHLVRSDPRALAGKPRPEPKRQPTLPELLAGAIAKNADKQGWARVSAVANHMRQHHGQSAKDHGKATWTKVLKGLPGYEFRNEGTTSVAVRVKKSG